MTSLGNSPQIPAGDNKRKHTIHPVLAYSYDRESFFLASTLAFFVLSNTGLFLSSFTFSSPPPMFTVEEEIPVALAARTTFAAASALRLFAPLVDGRAFVRSPLVVPPDARGPLVVVAGTAPEDGDGTLINTLPPLSTFFIKGLGRFSSSVGSYIGAGGYFGAGTGLAGFVVVACCWRRAGFEPVADVDEEEVDEDEDEDEEPFVEVDEAEPEISEVVRLSVGRCVDARIEGFLSLVGGPLLLELETCCCTVLVDDADADPAEDVDDPVSDNSALSFSFSFHSRSFLTVGLGGGESTSSDSVSVLAVLSLLSSLNGPSRGLSSRSDSRIFVKPSPTRGLWLNKLTSSLGVGVTSVSPVAVRTTPFIAEGKDAV